MLGREDIQGQCWFLHSFSVLFLPRVLHCILAILVPPSWLLGDYTHVVSLNISNTLAFGVSWKMEPKTELVTVMLQFFYLKKTMAALIFLGLFIFVCVCPHLTFLPVLPHGRINARCWDISFFCGTMACCSHAEEMPVNDKWNICFPTKADTQFQRSSTVWRCIYWLKLFFSHSGWICVAAPAAFPFAAMCL